MNQTFLSAIAPDPSTTESDAHRRTPEHEPNPTVHGAPVIYDQPPAGAVPGNRNPVNGDVDPFALDDSRDDVAPFNPPGPAPIIFASPVGGVALDAGQIVNAAGVKLATIGTASEGRPDVLGMLLQCSAGAGTVEILPNGSPDSLTPGFQLPAFAAGQNTFFMPLKRANVRLTGVVTLSFLVIASGLTQGQ